MAAEVALARCGDYEPESVRRALREALSPIGGLDWVRPGMRVGVKINLVTGKKPEAAATTHPALLCALAEMLAERGASVVMGDSPGGLYTAAYVRRAYAAAGLRAVESSGARLNDNFAEAEKDCPGAAVAKHIRYTAWLDDCDAIVNFAKLKTHGMMGLTAAAKNMFGVVPGTVKPEYHYRYPDPMDFARMIVDLDDAFPIRLCLVDAVVGMEGNGPTAGRPRPVGCLLASTDPHRLDMVCAAIIGLEPLSVPTLLAAKERGYVPDTVSAIVTNRPIDDFCVPDYENINVGRLMEQDGNAAIFGKSASALFARVLRTRPQVNKSQCIGCRECERVCPAGAIAMVGGKPKIHRDRCIRCFCCQEFCPKGAMEVRRSAVARLLGRL